MADDVPTDGITAPNHGGGTLEPGAAAAVMRRRELYWQNVMREILSGLAAAAAMSAGRLSATPSGAATGGSPTAELFDGRLAVLTTSGQRIPISDVVPMFSCSVSNGDKVDRLLSTEVQCTVFQIRTPNGEVHTLPVHMITGFHALSDQLVTRLQEAAQAANGQGRGTDDGERRPFGFAAFTSLAQGERDSAGG
ncbi:MAG: hypothetical protein AAF235_02880 [Planctomycetota bacterium]